MTALYLVRHAHAEWTPDDNRPLSIWGYADAERVADLLGVFPIAAVYASPARRAQETVMSLAARLGLPIGEVADLRERELGRFTTDDFEGAVRATWEDRFLFFPGGESNAAAERRGVAAIEDVLDCHPTQHVVVSTHGNLLTLILQQFDPSIGFSFWQALTMPDVYRLELDAGHTTLRRLWQS